MQGIISAIGRTLRKSALILITLTLLVSSVFIFVQQPSLAAPASTEGQKLIQQEKVDEESEAVNLREQDYEEEVEAEKDLDKVYRENLKDNPGPSLVDKAVEGAEKLVDKVTGK